MRPSGERRLCPGLCPRGCSGKQTRRTSGNTSSSSPPGMRFFRFVVGLICLSLAEVVTSEVKAKSELQLRHHWSKCTDIQNPPCLPAQPWLASQCFQLSLSSVTVNGECCGQWGLRQSLCSDRSRVRMLLLDRALVSDKRRTALSASSTQVVVHVSPASESVA